MKEETKNGIKKYAFTILKVLLVSPIVLIAGVVDVLLQIACAVVYAIIGDHKAACDVLDKIKSNL